MSEIKGKSPSYQWYPKDVLTDKSVMRMNHVEENCYRRLLDYSWLENGLDDDVFLLAAYCKMSGQVEQFKKIWSVVKKEFSLRGGKWKNSRQERERRKQKSNSKSQSERAKKSWGS